MRQRHALPAAAGFVWQSLCLIVSGSKGDSAPHAMPLWWRKVMGLSCALYLLPAVVWWQHGWACMAALFVLVSVCSSLADAVRLDLDVVRSVDRAVGAVALTSSCVLNCTTFFNAALCMVSVVTSLCWLRAGRVLRHSEPHNITGYLLLHAAWHGWGAMAVCLVTQHVQSSDVQAG
jgi:hypothetical protein